MSQHDLVIDNASGATVRADINSALAALGSNMKGTGAPSAPLAGMQWVEDDNPSTSVWTWKVYDGTDWIALGQIDATNNRFTPTGLFSAGTAALPSFAPAGDPDTGLWAPSGNTLALSTGGTEAVRVDSTQNVGIGTSSPGTRLHIANSGATDTYLRATNSAATGGFDVGVAASGACYVWNRNNTTLAFGINNAERMTIALDGVIRIAQNSTSQPGSSNTTQGSALGSDGTAHFSSNTAGAGYVALFNRVNDGSVCVFNRAGVNVGHISVTTTATAYNTSSDYRLKEDFEPITDAVALVAATPVYQFRWKATPGAAKVFGFVAHEAQATVPEAVTGFKDGPQMQGIDQSKMVPLLWAAVQELAARVAALEAQLAPSA